MFPVVYILHSESNTFSASLITNAIMCIRAMCNTLCAHSPDFIPPCAILRANPEIGVQYIYSTAIPDGNHAINKSHIYSVLNSLASLSLPTKTTSEARDVPAGLIGRSASYMTDSLIVGTGSLDKDKPITTKTKLLTTTNIKLHDTNNMTTYSTETDCEASVKSEEDTWACLAGALLAALCFLNKHHMMNSIPDHEVALSNNNDSNTDTENANHNNNINNISVGKTNSKSSGGCIIIFSEGDHEEIKKRDKEGSDDVNNDEYHQEQKDSAKKELLHETPFHKQITTSHASLSFSTECAFANIAICLSKTSFTVHCFSKSVFALFTKQNYALQSNVYVQESQEQSNKKYKESTNSTNSNDTNVENLWSSYYTTGASRVCALVSSLDGICAPTFEFAHLGKLFTIHEPHIWNLFSSENNGLEVLTVDNNATKSENTSAFTRRRRRERMAEQYVIRPTLLPQSIESVIKCNNEDSSSNNNVSGNLAWLCPRCMAIIEQTETDMFSTNSEQFAKSKGKNADTESYDDADYCKICPYCTNKETQERSHNFLSKKK